MTHQDAMPIAAGEYEFHRLIGAGAFAQVFEGVHRQTGERRAFKVARSKPLRKPGETRPVYSTEALVGVTGCFLHADVDPAIVLRAQFEKLRVAGADVYPQVDGMVECDGGRPAIAMEFLRGANLRDLIVRHAVPDELPLVLVRTLARLENSGQRHGDLKPENIFWTNGRVVLLDPGFDGSLPGEEGPTEHVTVTTRAYYPLIRPDDIMAFGIVLLELVTGTNPFAETNRIEEGLLSPSLQTRLEGLHGANLHGFDAVCQLSGRTGLGEKMILSPLWPVIFQSLGLRFGHQVGEANQYSDFAAIEVGLQRVLLLQGVGAATAAQTALPARSPAMVRCFECNLPVGGEDHCPHCRASRLAPACPKCGQPVSRARNQAVSNAFPAASGAPERMAWNSEWNNRCVQCGFEFGAKIAIATGHVGMLNKPSTEFQAAAGDASGTSIVRFCGMESTHMTCDHWDHQPVIEVQVKRAVAANCGSQEDDDGLPLESTIRMTIEEWNAVFEQLRGPLQPLMQRRAWSRDTT